MVWSKSTAVNKKPSMKQVQNCFEYTSKRYTFENVASLSISSSVCRKQGRLQNTGEVEVVTSFYASQISCS